MDETIEHARDPGGESMPLRRGVGQPAAESWTLEDSRRLYNLGAWSEGYFDIDAGGRLVVSGPGGPVALEAILQRLEAEGFSAPVLLRFPHILRDRLRRMVHAFEQARSRHGYAQGYTPVYPIKVNQQRYVVEALLDTPGVSMGLEAGSKPELLAVLALAPADGATVVCNGYKDREYVRLALIGAQLGKRIYVVIEKPGELERVLREARDLGVAPLLGLRVRLGSVARGKWQNTGGERAKFGLSAGQVLEVLERLRSAGQLDRLRMMHFHAGSQIPDLGELAAAMQEAARYYVALREQGAPIQVVDVGGGIGVDYEGTHSTAYCSVNYDLEGYAETVVSALARACARFGMPHPEIITESGRALVAHHAVLVARVVEAERMDGGAALQEVHGHEPSEIQRLRALEAGGAAGDAVRLHARARRLLEEVQTLFIEGEVDLALRSVAEALYARICARLLSTAPPGLPHGLEEDLRRRLADKYFVNFSLFQSLPDVWAFDQIFPVVPLDRLDERPGRRAVLHDLTCDSDGQISRYVDSGCVETTLAVHALEPGARYALGFFLVGAYQEILGDRHNLFGDTHSVDVELSETGGFRFDRPEAGERVEDLLRSVHYDPDRLFETYRSALQRRGPALEERQRLLGELALGLRAYTYLEDSTE